MPVISVPLLLYVACALGAVGVAMALPRRGLSPQVLGAVLAALGLGGILIALAPRAAEHVPNVFYYLFTVIALGASLRVISHPRPVYAALYFILTILASSGLYLILSAEFMAFALIIVYAGAILITYLFVIMLATEAPSAEHLEALSSYDRYSREPIVATVMAFLLLAVLTTVMARGASSLQPAGAESGSGMALLSRMPVKIEKVLRREGLMSRDETLRGPDGEFGIDLAGGEILVHPYGRVIRKDQWPADLVTSNTEGVGFELLVAKPGAIEIAGVILLMAMLGAVVLARKKVELDDEAKLRAQERHLDVTAGGAA